MTLVETNQSLPLRQGVFGFRELFLSQFPSHQLHPGVLERTSHPRYSCPAKTTRSSWTGEAATTEAGP